ncbi:MAG: hypothetical protein ACLQUZ_06710 [Rhizomicrobium sp.]
MGSKSRLARGLTLGVAAAAFVSVMGWSGQGSWTNFGSPAMADAPASSLSAVSVAEIQVAVQTAIANVNPSLTGSARAQAIAQAIAQVTATEVAIDGAAAVSVVVGAAISSGIPAAQVVADVLPAAIEAGVPAATAISDIVVGAVSAGASATQVTEAIIAVAGRDQITSSSVGTGLGQAAALLSASDPSAANQIAQAVSNEGTYGTGQAFYASVIANGGSQQLANAGTQNPHAGTVATNPVFGAFTGNGNGRPQSNTPTTIQPNTCTNPSCT